MAKGNDGNYLQHAAELRLAIRLAGSEGRLHIALTHGMEPFEACDVPGQAQHGHLDAALAAAARPAVAGEDVLVTAYRSVSATRQHYPNSGEIIAATLGRNNLSGCITEKDPLKAPSLQAAWAGTAVRAVNDSWRGQVMTGLACPARLDRPWLVSMDPMTWAVDAGDIDDASLRHADLERIKRLVAPYVASGRPGAAAVFVYRVHKDIQPDFRGEMDALAKRLGLEVLHRDMLHNGGNRNLLAVLRTSPG